MPVPSPLQGRGAVPVHIRRLVLQGFQGRGRRIGGQLHHDDGLVHSTHGGRLLGGEKYHREASRWIAVVVSGGARWDQPVAVRERGNHQREQVRQLHLLVNPVRNARALVRAVLPGRDKVQPRLVDHRVPGHRIERGESVRVLQMQLGSESQIPGPGRPGHLDGRSVPVEKWRAQSDGQRRDGTGHRSKRRTAPSLIIRMKGSKGGVRHLSK